MRDTGALRQSTICTFDARSMKPRLPIMTSRTLPFSFRRMCAKYGDATSTACDAQIAALDAGYTYGLLWVAAVAVLVGGAALFIGYTAKQVAHAQEVKDAIDAGEL